MIKFPHRGWLFDLDGTIYLGEALIPGADRVIAALREAGRRVAFLSNKPLETREDYARKLTRLGVAAGAEDVINSSLVLARHLAALDPGAPVFVIGEPLRYEKGEDMELFRLRIENALKEATERADRLAGAVS